MIDYYNLVDCNFFHGFDIGHLNGCDHSNYRKSVYNRYYIHDCYCMVYYTRFCLVYNNLDVIYNRSLVYHSHALCCNSLCFFVCYDNRNCTHNSHLGRRYILDIRCKVFELCLVCLVFDNGCCYKSCLTPLILLFFF